MSLLPQSVRRPSASAEPDLPSRAAGSGRRHRGLLRSVRLFRLFRKEQTDPESFYTGLAEDTVRQVEDYCELQGRTVVDVGGGPGHFTAAFAERGARCYLFEPDSAEMLSRGAAPSGAVIADGYWLPVRDGGADVCLSSNVLEHVRDPLALIDGMVRATRPGGLVYLSFTHSDPPSRPPPRPQRGGDGGASEAQAGGPPPWPAASWRWFLLVWLLALIVFAANDPGRMIFDTKLGVDINAASFYARLWPLWNPLESFGTLQNQYIGYAIPMAPFFLARQLLPMPRWLLDRLWPSLLFAVAL